MTQEEAFLADIAEHPDDDGPRLVFADWLEDHGDAARAEFIRVQCELARLGADDPAGRPLREREAALLGEHKERWAEGITKRGAYAFFERGMLDQVICAEPKLLLPHVDIFRRHPVRRLEVRRNDGELVPLLASPHLERIEDLRFSFLNGAGEVAHALSGFTHYRRLRHLDFASCEVHSDSLGVLLRAPFIPRLQSLGMVGNPLGANGAEALAKGPFAALQQLDLTAAGLDDTALQFLAAASSLRGLKELDVRSNQIGPAGVRALARAAGLASLESLILDGNRLGEDGGEALFRSPLLARLRSLSLGTASLGPAAVAALARASLPHLNKLDLSGNPLGADGAAHLARWQGGGPLRSLSLAECDLGNEGATALAAWPGLKELTELDLSWNRLTAFGLKALTGSGRLERVSALALKRNKLRDLGAQVVARWPGLANVRRLDLTHNDIHDEGACELARSPHLVRMEVLGLKENAYSEGAVAAFNDPAVRSRIDELELDDP